MTGLSNSLTDLAERVKEANRLSDIAHRQSIEKALEAGCLLIEAKAAVQHGEWLPFLVRAAVHERQARRLMQLARSGLQIGHVSDLGGIGAALQWMQGLTLPKPGEILIVSLDDFSELAMEPMAFVVPAQGGHHVYMLDVTEASPHAFYTRSPIIAEHMVYLTVYHVLDFRLSEMTFETLPDAICGEVITDIRALRPAS